MCCVGRKTLLTRVYEGPSFFAKFYGTVYFVMSYTSISDADITQVICINVFIFGSGTDPISLLILFLMR